MLSAMHFVARVAIDASESITTTITTTMATMHTVPHDSPRSQMISGMLALLIAAASNGAAAETADVIGHAIVRDDASLLINNQVVHLYGIYIPSTNRTCRGWINPVRCGSRAALALDFKTKGFIHCFEQYENSDGSIDATCWQDRTAFDAGVDLAAYLIERGWAMALPGAPFEYHAMERIARSRELGVWGWPVDSMTDGIYPKGSPQRR